MNVAFETSLKEIAGLNWELVRLLEQELHIATVEEALLYLPFRYVDRRFFVPVDDVRGPDGMVQVVGVVSQMEVVGQGRKQRLVAKLQGSRRSIDVVWFRGVRFHYRRIRIGSRYVAFGKVDRFGSTLTMTHPEFDLYTEEMQKTARIEGVYSSTAKINRLPQAQRAIADLIRSVANVVLMGVEDPLDERFYARCGLIPLRQALWDAHFPKEFAEVERALKRLKFDEAFFVQLRLQQFRVRSHTLNSGIEFSRVGNRFNKLYKEELPFDLTRAQKRVLHEMHDDMRSGRQMNRLLQGDVGSGKTLVALFSMLLAVDNGYQSCLMAPTEILAQQHYSTIKRFTANIGVTVALITGNIKRGERERLRAELQAGKIDILIGTHALIEDDISFNNLGIVVVDEQHRFGVDQRATLWAKGTNRLPHILVMTATPIPRTLSMTLYGDLDVSVIDELPPGRKPIKTVLVYEEQRGQVYEGVVRELAKGRQAYVVYPLIEENEKMDFASLEEGFVSLKQFFEPRGYLLAMLHGRMSPDEKNYAMRAFSDNRVQVLVSTTVVEVGVDVPNATVMLIESAQRFGLSQMHQLRGRVGRGGEESYCLLMTPYNLSPNTRARIETMVRTNDGFEIAEADLRLRGPGDIDGTKQSGVATQFRLIDVKQDCKLIEMANAEAKMLIQEDPLLAKPENAKIKSELARRALGSRYSKIG